MGINVGDIYARDRRAPDLRAPLDERLFRRRMGINLGDIAPKVALLVNRFLILAACTVVVLLLSAILTPWQMRRLKCAQFFWRRREFGWLGDLIWRPGSTYPQTGVAYGP